MALSDVLSQAHSTPYHKLPPIHILVVDMVEQQRVMMWEFEENTATARLTKVNRLTAVTDGKSVAKFTLFEELSTKIKTGMSYIMKNYNVRGQYPAQYIIITEKTLFFRASAITAPEDLLKAARDLVHPQSVVTPLSSSHEQKGFMTVQGEVIEISALKKIKTGKEEVPFRNILLKQEKTEVQLCLWREAAVFDVPLGGVLTVSHVNPGRSDYGHRLQSTNFTKMEVEVSDKMENVEIIGVMEAKKKGMLTLLLGDDTLLNIDEKLWEPLDDLLKVNKVVANVEKVGRTVTSITPVEGQN